MDRTTKNNNVLRFIELYRNHEILWNINLPSYRRNDLKKRAYESISAYMKMSVEEVKKKIKSLRTAYSAEKSKVEKSKKSDADSIYIPTVFWYNEMTFLNASCIPRTTVDNSDQNILNSQNFEDYNEEFETFKCDEYCSDEKPSKRPRKKERPKSDEAVVKLIKINDMENEFTAFASSLAHQLQKLPEEDSYELMGEMQNLLTQRKLRHLRKQKGIPTSSDDSS